jgi:hypothetical protein
MSRARWEPAVPVIERSKSSFRESQDLTFIYFFMVYLTTLSLVDTIGLQRSYVNELEGMCLKTLFLKGLRKSMKTVSQENLCPSRDSSEASPEQDSEELPLEAACSVWLL